MTSPVKLILLLLSIAVSIYLQACSEEKIKPQVNYTIEDENIPVQESWNSTIYFTENGELKAVLYSDHLMVYNEPREKLLENLAIDFFNEKGKKTSRLTSKRGRIDDITENMYAIDSVVAINDSSNVKLETDELMWRKSDHKIVSDKFVKITSPEEIIEGYGFESDQNLHNYTIFDITYQTSVKKSK